MKTFIYKHQLAIKFILKNGSKQIDTSKILTRSDGYTKEEVDEIIDDLPASGGDADLSDYYTKEETDTAISTAIAEIEIPEANQADVVSSDSAVNEQLTINFNNAEIYLIDLNDAPVELVFDEMPQNAAITTIVIIPDVNETNVITWPSEISWVDGSEPSLGSTKTLVTLLWDTLAVDGILSASW